MVKKLIYKILLENNNNKLFNLIDKYLSSQGLEKWDYSRIWKYLDKLGYETSEIKSLYREYLSDGQEMSDLELIDKIILMIYGPLQLDYDEDNDEHNFFDKSENLIFSIDWYNNAVVPFFIKDISNVLMIDYIEVMKEYFIYGFGLRINEVHTSVAIG